VPGSSPSSSAIRCLATWNAARASDWRWLAYPNKPASQIFEVDYLIDGKVRWIEHFAPYNYGSDDFRAIPSAPTPGPSRETS
jgi:hypothetical protein